MKKTLLAAAIFITFILRGVAPENSYDFTQTYTILQEHEQKQEFKRFLSHLAIRESSANWKIYNQWGYLGLYQIGYAARLDIGYGHITFRDFIRNPHIFPAESQENAVRLLIQQNIERMYPYSSIYYLSLYSIDGQEINGVKLTLGGMIAGAHLAGPYGMKRYIKTKGKYNPQDALGTYLSDYVKEFSDYNLNLNQL